MDHDLGAVSSDHFAEYAADYTSATTIMRFPDNVIAKCHVNSSCVFPQVNDLVVLGERGSYIDGVLYEDGRGFRQLSDFFGDGPARAEVNITSVKLPSKLVAPALTAYMRTANALVRSYLHGFSKLTRRLMRHPDFAFRRFPLNVYNHDLACQVVIDNFVAAVLDGADVLVGFDDATRAIRLCEEAEADGLANMGRSQL